MREHPQKVSVIVGARQYAVDKHGEECDGMVTISVYNGYVDVRLNLGQDQAAALGAGLGRSEKANVVTTTGQAVRAFTAPREDRQTLTTLKYGAATHQQLDLDPEQTRRLGERLIDAANEISTL